MGKVGNRVRLSIERPSRDLIERFRDAMPPDLADAMNKSGAMRDIIPMYAPMPTCVGSAITVDAPTGDAMVIRKAIEIAQPGDVIVINGGGMSTRSLWGGNRSTLAGTHGVAGVIVDGGTRDIHETQAAGLPLFARAVAPMSNSSTGPGELNFPISCGGQVVNPGDIVVANAEGIVVIPKDDAEDVYAAWKKVVDREADWHAKAPPARTSAAKTSTPHSAVVGRSS